MQIHLQKKVSYLRESIILLTRIAMEEDEQKLFQKIHHNKNIDFHCTMLEQVYTKVSHQVKKELAEQKLLSEVRYFFTLFKENECNCLALALFDPYCDFQIDDMDQQITQCKQQALQNPHYFLQYFTTEEYDENNAYTRFLTDIEEYDYTAEIRWQILCIYNDLATALDRLLPLLRIVCDQISLVEADLQVLITSFWEIWHQEFTQATMYEQLADNYGFDFAYKHSGDVYVYPAILAFNSFTLMARLEFGKRDEQIFWGVIALPLYLPDDNLKVEELCMIMKLLGDKSKFEILKFIAKKPAFGAQIAKELNLSTPTISYHMQALLSAGLIAIHREGTNRIYYSPKKDSFYILLECLQEQLL